MNNIISLKSFFLTKNGHTLINFERNYFDFFKLFSTDYANALLRVTLPIPLTHCKKAVRRNIFSHQDLILPFLLRICSKNLHLAYVFLLQTLCFIYH